MASVTVNSASLGTPLTEILQSGAIEPGSEPSYELCKTILLYHPLGQRMAESPVKLALSQRREIAAPSGPEERIVEAFNKEWDRLDADKHIINLAKLSRTYGVASLAIGETNESMATALDLDKLADADIFFSVFDPLNTAGSLVLNQDPNAPDFLKHTDITVSGRVWHRSRAVVLMNEEPVYIAYTTSAFGYTGRSVYQRALYPLKTFIQSMITDDMVTQKAGLLIAKMKPAGSIIDGAMTVFAGLKRAMLQGAATGNVLSIAPEESIETLNMMNVDGAAGFARGNVIKNIATAADMPAAIISQDTLTQGFGEGTEDAKNIARYVDGLRSWLKPAYDFLDPIVQHRAWNREFYAAIQADFKEYAGVTYEQAFTEWSNSFSAEWPNFLIEPESERVKVDETKHKAIIGVIETMAPQLDPENKAELFKWASENLNENKLLFSTPLNLDIDALKEYVPPTPPDMPGEREPEMP